MAEHFYGENLSLHTSNGGGELFIECLLVFAELGADAPEHAQVLSFLKSRVERGYGWRFFELDPLPESLSSEPALRFLIDTVACLAESLVSEHIPESLRSSFSNRNFQLKWAAFAFQFHGLLRDAAEFDVPAPKLAFRDSKDERVCRLEYLKNHLYHASKFNNLTKQVELFSEIIELEKKGVPSKPIWLLFSDKAAILLKMDDTNETINALREGASNAEGEVRQELEDEADLLELEMIEKRESESRNKW